MENKKICFIASAPIGIVSFHKTNIELLSKRFDVYVIANFNDRSIFNDLCIKKAIPINIVRKPNIIENIQAIIELYKIFRRYKFDCFISMSSNASLLASIAGYIARVPKRIRIFTGQIWANYQGLKRTFFKTIDKITVSLNTSILVDSRPQRDYLVKNGILNLGQGTILANGSICGVDTSKFIPNEDVRKMERKKFGIKDSDVVFTFMGRVNKDKGIFELLEATNQLVSEVNSAVLVLIGNMEGLTPDVLSQNSNLHLGKNIILYGYTKEPYRALQLSDVFCLPSHREGFGMSAIEAASLSLPVICSDIYGLQDSFVPNETGLCCKVNDPVSLYESMKKLYFDKQLRMELGIKGRERVKQMFDKELVSKAWFKYIKKELS